MAYERIFEKPYEDGYEDLPLETTPVTARTLNDKDNALEHIEDYLETVIEANPTLSGTEDALEAISIEGIKFKIEGGGGGGTTVIANPTLIGTEDDLSGLQVGNTKYKVATVEANPSIIGTEADLTALKIGNTKYKVPSGGGGGTSVTFFSGEAMTNMHYYIYVFGKYAIVYLNGENLNIPNGTSVQLNLPITFKNQILSLNAYKGLTNMDFGRFTLNTDNTMRFDAISVNQSVGIISAIFMGEIESE